jgi:hypothetical protein
MTQYVFGTGQLFAMPVGGGAPLRFGALQDVSLDISADVKELHGQYGFALDVARGKAKVEWKAATANIDIAAFNQLYFGGTVVAGNEYKQAIRETGTVPAMSTYTVTVANAATFEFDLGVYYATTGIALKQVPSGPVAGQYSVSSVGVYTFAAADASAALLFDYMYHSASTGGTLTVTNQLMGTIPKFQLVLSETYNNQNFVAILYSAVADKLSLPLKQDDHLVAELSGSAQADALNRIMKLSTNSITGGGA